MTALSLGVHADQTHRDFAASSEAGHQKQTDEALALSVLNGLSGLGVMTALALDVDIDKPFRVLLA